MSETAVVEVRASALAGRAAQVGADTLRIYTLASEAYVAMLEAIDLTRERVRLETYILRDDQLGAQFAAALTRAAARGVEVRLLADWFGCVTTSSAYFERLRQAGVGVSLFNPVSLLRAHYLWPLRDHRKILVCDGRVAFTGSLNIGNEFCGYDTDGIGWHEVHVRIEGPAAAELERLFDETWETAVLGRPWYRPPPPRELLRRLWTAARRQPPRSDAWSDGGQLRILRSGTWRDGRTISRVYEGLLKRARHRVTIMNPYFIPGRRFLRALKTACRRGVRVRLMSSASTDVPPAWYASRNLYARLLQWGVEIWLWRGAHLHSKVVVVDESWAAIGSYNFDNFSLLRNLEVVVSVSNRTVAASLEETFEREKPLCTRLELPAWKRRSLAQKLLERLAYLLRYWL